jgi:hypothetical protein
VEYFFRDFSKDTRWGTGEENNLESNQFSNKYVLALAAVIFTQVQQVSYVHIAQVYEDAFNSRDLVDPVMPTME